MPQLDKLTYFSQFFWLCLLLFTFYILFINNNNGILGISRILKLRNQLLSHRGNKIRSKDPKNLEDISRKGFSTGLSYMYSSLSEVSQWCQTVDYLRKRRKITQISDFGEIRGSFYIDISVGKIIGKFLPVRTCLPLLVLLTATRCFLLWQISSILYAIIGLVVGSLTPCFVGDFSPSLSNVGFCVSPPQLPDSPGAMVSYSSFKESTGEIDVLMEDTSMSTGTGEQSVNQTFRDIEKEHFEQQRHLCIREIKAEMLQQYKKDVGKRHFLMKISFSCYNVFNQGRMESDIDSICHDLEIYEFSLPDLQNFLFDIKKNKNLLNSFFLNAWP